MRYRSCVHVDVQDGIDSREIVGASRWTARIAGFHRLSLEMANVACL